jgi:acyl-CoA reductase-like NAD-dependent aldehyde dehydrogenase
VARHARATHRGALLHKPGDLIAARVGDLARTEVRDGKLIAETPRQTRYLPWWYYYQGGHRRESGKEAIYQ